MQDKKIPGIYNYCDRWCERCAFGSRCALYEDEMDMAAEEKDMRNKAFWNRLVLNFAKAHQLLEQAAEQYGADVNVLSEEMNEYEEKRKKVKEECKDHPVSKLSWKYSQTSRKWLKTQPGMIDRLETLRNELTMGVESVEDAKIKTASIKDCLAVIQWYQDFIHVKFMRALMGKLKDDGREEENDFQRDSDGAAKIAIIAIERSMQAWISLYQLLPDREDDFLPVLGMLEKMKTMASEEFPRALSFKRPGFDD